MSNCSDLKLFYNETYTVSEHHTFGLNNCTVKRIKIEMLQHSYKVTLKITNMQVQHNYYYYYATDIYDELSIYAKELGISKVLIIDCQFISNTYADHLLLFASSRNGNVQFINCQFINNKPNIYPRLSLSLIRLNEIVKIELVGCNFYASSVYPARVLQTHGKNTDPATTQVVIKNTNFTYVNHKIQPDIKRSFISLLHTTLLLEDSVVFFNISVFNYIISLKGNSIITISGTVQFSNNRVHDLIEFFMTTT